MIRLPLESYIKITEYLRLAGQVCHEAVYNGPRADFRDVVPGLLEQASKEAGGVGANITSKRCNRIMQVASGATDMNALYMLVQDLQGLFFDEMEQWRVIALTPEEARLMESTEPFGTDVATRFQSCSEDIRLATQMLALESPAACILHLIRATERPLKTVYMALGCQAKGLGTWGSIRAEIKKAIEADGCSQGLKNLGRDILDCTESLKIVRDSRVMHVDDDLPDLELALKIYAHTKTLMEHVAKHIDEDGNPILELADTAAVFKGDLKKASRPVGQRKEPTNPPDPSAP